LQPGQLVHDEFAIDGDGEHLNPFGSQRLGALK
jgi:hypothetical protein